MTAHGRISLMAAADLRDALRAWQSGDIPAAMAALMSIDPDSWNAIETRLNTMGGSLPELLTHLSRKD